MPPLPPPGYAPGILLNEPSPKLNFHVCDNTRGSSLVPRPHPLRGEGSGEKRQDPWFMTSFCNVINNYYL